MSLVELPEEILLLIADHVWPGDLVSFSSACKKLLHVATSRLEEAKGFSRDYHTLRMACGFDMDMDWDNPIHVIEQIQGDWRIAHYIHTIEFSPYEEFMPEPLVESTVAKLLKNQYGHPWLSKLTFLSEDEKSTWEHDVRNDHNPDPLFIVLLACATNLKTLHLVVAPSKFRQRIEMYMTAQYPQFDRLTGSLKPNGLRHLTKLMISHDDSEGGVPLIDIGHLLLIPTLREAHLHAVVDTDDNIIFKWPEGRESDCKIEDVLLTYSQISPQNLNTLVQGMPMLSKLMYEDEFVSQSEWWVSPPEKNTEPPVEDRDGGMDRGEVEDDEGAEKDHDSDDTTSSSDEDIKGYDMFGAVRDVRQYAKIFHQWESGMLQERDLKLVAREGIKIYKRAPKPSKKRKLSRSD